MNLRDTVLGDFLAHWRHGPIAEGKVECRRILSRFQGGVDSGRRGGDRYEVRR